ncbi:MAG: choice-of-anchor D domain-containing protein, partial [Opitutaceae bacterium]
MQIEGSTIVGGALTATGGGTFNQGVNDTNVTLDGSTSGALTLSSGTTWNNGWNSATYVNGSIVNSGTIGITSGGGGYNSYLELQGNTTLSGGGTVTLGSSDGSGTAYILQTGSNLTLTNADNTIEGFGVIGNGTLAVINGGTLLANSAGNTLLVNGSGGLTNNGTLQANAGSTLQVTSNLTNFSAGTLTGGTYIVTGNALNAGTMQISSFGTGGGELVTNSATIALNGVNSDLTDSSGLNALNNGTTGLTTNTATGAFDITSGRVFNSVGNLSNAGNVEASGSGTNLIVGPTGTNTYTQTAGNTLLTIGGTLTAGTTHISGGTLTLNNGNIVSPVLTNDVGGTITGSGTITSATVSNQGLIQAAGPSLTLSNGVTGTGTLQTNTGSTLSLAGGTTSSTTGTLSLTGPLALGTNNITVSTIYTNANFGTGNSFNDHANVTGAGQILAAGNTALTITGAAVTNGGTATPTLTLGAIHVGGSETVDYAIQNSGSTGPSVTGAIQTGVNGGNITNGALSGTGVTAGNFAQLASGQSTTAYAITYDPTVAGALTGQKVHVASNFDNVTGPTITLTGGAAYNLASVNTLTTPVSLGNVHVGGTLDTALSISNTAPVNATYTETLAASVTGTTGGASTAGSISGLVAGAGPSTAISVGLNTATAGALSGTATVGFSSQAVNSSGLGTTALSSQTVTVTGNAYALASANSISTPINFGNFHVGATESTALGISNTAAVNPTYTETLAASVSGTTGSANSAGSISGLVAGAGPSTAISVGLNTGTAGALTGTATVGFSSQAVNGSGLGTTSLGSQILTINGAAYNLASASLGTINLGPVLVGSVVNPTLSVTNSGPVGSYTEGLDAAVAGFTGGVGSYLTSTNSLTNIAAGNSSNLTFSLNTSSAAVVAGTVLVNLDSNGTGTSGLGITALAQKSAPVDVTIEETVGNLANPSAATPNPVVLNARLGAASPTQALSITNLATGGPQEGLNASISTASTGVTAAGSFTSLAASGTNNSSLVVGINTGTAGAINGTATVALASDGTLNGSNNYATTTLTPQTITVQGGVYQEAAASITPSSNPVNLGSARIGGTLGQALTIT